MRKIKICLMAVASIATLTLTTLAMASVALPVGWYLEGNAGTSRQSNVSYGAGLSSSIKGFGWSVNGGYKFMPYFATELGFTRYGQSKATFNGTNIANDSHYSYHLAAKAILPVSDSGVDFFAKLGIARINSHVVISNPNVVYANNLSVNAGSHTVTAAYFGFGGDYNFMPNSAVNIQWNRAKGNNTTGFLDLYSIGLSYIFG